MSFYYVAGIPGNRIRRVNKIDKILTSRELTFQGREIDNKQVNKWKKDDFDSDKFCEESLMWWYGTVTRDKG